MEFSIKSGSPEKQQSACVVVGVFETRKLCPSALSIDSASGQYLTELIRQGDMEGKLGSTLLLHRIPGIKASRVLLVGLGKEKDFSEKNYRNVIGAAIKHLNGLGGKDTAIYLTDLKVGKRNASWRVREATIIAHETLYRFEQLKSKPDDTKRALEKVDFCLLRSNDVADAEHGLTHGEAIAAGTNWAKDLGNLPSNICTPTYLADQARNLGKEFKLNVEILERKDMEALGMHSLLSVAKGSIEPPKFIMIRHLLGKKSDKPVVLVGKGITFDSGGISLKPGPEMDEMKYDMCGAASVMGTLRAAAMLRLPINLIGVVAASENMPSGNASKPGDIVKSMSGQTIEILNTDAEGRLILCDALTYVERFDPSCVVDVATLTGACVIALGHVASGLFANDDSLASELLDAGQESGDRAWQMPLWPEYQEMLKSNFADMANIGGRAGGSITAASFLARYTEKLSWAHLDIAGTAWKSGKEKGATGRPVPLLTQFLLSRAGNAKVGRRKRK